jgi:hypothetical protein
VPVAPAVLRITPGQTWTVPAGTEISLRTVDRIDPAQAEPGQGYAAVLVRNLLNESGGVIALSGSPARLTVLRTGAGQEQLGLSALMIAGNWISVRSGSAEQVQPLAGAAPLGTLVRGVSDGPTRGPVEQSMRVETTGADVQVPGEFLLIFRLEQPLQIGGGTP